MIRVYLRSSVVRFSSSKRGDAESAEASAEEEERVMG